MTGANRIVEYVFFFGLLGAVAYLVWEIIAPFAGALALAAIIVTICYPLYEIILKRITRNNKTVASLLSVLVVMVVVIIPLILLGTILLNEAQDIYTLVNEDSQVTLESSLVAFEQFIQKFIPGFSIEITSYINQLTTFIASNISAIFTGTASTIFLFFIALFGSFYFFRDGKVFTKFLIQISPLPDKDDAKILRRLAISIRSVALGTVLTALIQGTLTAIGLSLFGFERAVLWGCIAAMGALIPGIGTTIVFVPAIIYLLYTGQYAIAGGVFIWSAFAVGLIDNLIGPYLMSRGNKLHPFFILLSVLGGIAMFGPIGFILGPVSLTLLLVLLELYSMHISDFSKKK
ncbi:MAG: AI-2E family transporter [Candidatus Pacebacteria bacterium]|nr:AI-2E family transporter [Candidatus Paceibacterota bacterium]